MLKYFVTVGRSDYHGGATEHLKAMPELFEEQRKRIGKITPPAKAIFFFDESVDLPGDPSGGPGWHREVKSFAPCLPSPLNLVTMKILGNFIVLGANCKFIDALP